MCRRVACSWLGMWRDRKGDGAMIGLGERYFRKVWEWWCWDCRYRMVEEVVVDGHDRVNPVCPKCGKEMDGNGLWADWVYEGCMTVRDV